MTPAPTWQEIAARKQAERASRIPQEWVVPASSLPSPDTLDVRRVPSTSRILSQRELHITSAHDAVSLAAALRARTYSAEEVSLAFCKRAAVAQQLCNCVTEIFFAAALDRARWLDGELARTGTPVGPLHGVPVSLKDTFKVKGYDSSIGIASLAFKPAETNSLLVDILLQAGAVLYCKTNVPQTLMALDSENNVFGRVLNPKNRAVTAGGSSGGEGALLAMRGSVLGVGTDVGGSIRVPAMCNGLYGVKPSAMRVPFVGQEEGKTAGLNKVALQASAGPIARSIRDCEFFLKVVADARPWERDPSIAYGNWEEQGSIGQKPLFGVIRTDGLVTPLPPIRNVLDETVQKLQRAGIEVVEIDAPAFKKCQSLANAFFSVDGSNYMLDLLASTSEPLSTWLQNRLKRKAPIPLPKLLEMHALKTQLETEMLRIWSDKSGRRIDALLLPVAPHPTPPIDRWNAVGYTSSFVLLDYPAGTLPVRDVLASDLRPELTPEVLGSWDARNRELCISPPSFPPFSPLNT